ncbi:pyridoxal phosphate-dependent aminotransferase [bacterium]|nr:pyridoxal phosphate-dependent aminotransferase [bacterium]
MLRKSATLEISAKAKRMNAQGDRVISFSAGEPDFDTPENIKEAAKKALDKGYTKYTDTTGIAELKKAIRQKFMRENNLHYDEGNILVTSGAKYAIYAAIMAIVSPGEEVIIPAPYWVSYTTMVKLAGGKPVFCYTKEENGFKLKLDDLKPVITENTKAVIINTPNNPTGAVYEASDLEEITNYLCERKILIISDEIYEKVIYDHKQHVSLASIVPDKYKKDVIVINGVSKAYSMTGWRIGYAAAPKDIAERMTYFLAHTTSNANSIAMYATVEALNGPQNSVENMVRRFDRRREFMYEELKKIPGLVPIHPQGAFYIFCNFKHYLGKSVRGNVINTTIELANFLLDEAHVAVVPGESFGMPGYIRFSYATNMDNIAEGIDNLAVALADFE